MREEQGWWGGEGKSRDGGEVSGRARMGVVRGRAGMEAGGEVRGRAGMEAGGEVRGRAGMGGGSIPYRAVAPHAPING